MFEHLDYVNSRIEKAQEDKLERYLSGNMPPQSYEFDRGYLKAMQDVLGFQKDYISAKNPPRTEEDEE